MQYSIRRMTVDDARLLPDFLYECIFVPEGEAPPPREILNKPELRVYIARFGWESDDRGLLAEVDGRPVGAVWTRVMDDYGHIDDDTPSFAIAVHPEYRGMGIGSALMREMLDWLCEDGVRRASLSVQKCNRALRLYQRLGFTTVWEDAEEAIMVYQGVPPREPAEALKGK